MKKFKFLVLILLAFFLNHCKTQEKIEESQSEQLNQTLVLLFHYDKQKGLSLVESKVYDEVMSTHINNESKSAKNRLQIIFRKGVSIEIEHPLYAYAEYLTEDYSFLTAELELDEATFIIRYPYSPHFTEIEVKEILKNGKPKTINKFYLTN